MLQLKVVIDEDYDEANEEFVSADSVMVRLEHSLLSLSKWESEWEIPFLATDKKTSEQAVSYVRFMVVGEEVSELVFLRLVSQHLPEINEYIAKKMTATWFGEIKNDPQREVVTAELIYYWMIALGVPFECENWHLSRLLTLIRVCNVKNGKPDRKDKRQANADRRALNEQRRKEYGTRG